MIKVHNRHAAMVGNVHPGQDGMVSRETLNRYPWALTALAPVGAPVEPEPEPEAVEPEPGPPVDPLEAQRAEVNARKARRLISKAQSASEIRPFLDDPRSSVRTAAERKIKALA